MQKRALDIYIVSFLVGEKHFLEGFFMQSPYIAYLECERVLEICYIEVSIKLTTLAFLFILLGQTSRIWCFFNLPECFTHKIDRLCHYIYTTHMNQTIQVNK